jgi:signal transduction histidine kinase/CheY-like chemotaxis protein
MSWKKIPTLPAIGILALAYFLAGKAGLHLATLHKSASPVWPPAGIALGALLLCGYRVWPGIFIGAFLVNATTYGNVFTSSCIGLGNTLEALGAAWLIHRYARGPEVFERYQEVFRFVVVALGTTFISPLIGLTGLTLAGFADAHRYGSIFLTWWLGDATGVLVLAPFVVLWGLRPNLSFRFKHDLETTALLLSLFVLGSLVFGGWFPISTKNFPVPFIVAPILVWTAFRLSQRAAAAGTVILTALATWGTLRGFGPFVVDDHNQSLLIVQTFSAVFAVTALALSAGMTERRRVETALEEQRATVEAANRTKDNFLAMLSHELRTPLTPVVAALDALEPHVHSPEMKASLSMIRRNVELETQLIDDLLDLTRISRHKVQLHFNILDAHQAIMDVVEICRAEASEQKLRVHTNLRAGAHHVSADAAKLQQIMWNLLKNAIKFTPEGGEIVINSGNPSPQVLEIRVTDTGIGIDTEVMKRMFDPFEQGDLSFQHRYGGLGLGLAISKSLAQAHGGALVATSEGPNRGSTFTFTLQTVAPAKDRQSPGSTSPPASDRRSLRILLVDDHHDTCTALERLLVRRGHLVAPAHDMRSAMSTAGRGEFDLLISDIALPDGSGIELMTYLRAMSSIRGIAISGFGMNGDIERSLQAGFAEHLVKPLKIDKLEAAIQRVVSGAVPVHV